MASKPRWQDPVGLETINTIMKKAVPTWPNGLHSVQLELVSGILDETDILCCPETGDSESAAFSMPSLILSIYNIEHPDLYPTGLPNSALPIGVVVTPTKGLANNMVCLPASYHIVPADATLLPRNVPPLINCELPNQALPQHALTHEPYRYHHR